jgi:hypothetical protein
MSRYDPLDSPLSILPLATVQQWLADALQAEQQLLTGAKVATVAYAQGDGSRSVTYTPAEIDRLRARIAELSTFLGIGSAKRLRPMRVIF